MKCRQCESEAVAIALGLLCSVSHSPSLAVAQVASSTGTVSAEAQPPDRYITQEPDSYRQTVDAALVEFAAEHFEEARALFAYAHALYPNARTERGLGLVEFELRHYAESIVHLEAALRSSAKPLSPELQTETRQLLERANRFVARVRLVIEPSDAKRVLDGHLLEPPLSEVLVVQVGDHVLEMRASGFTPEIRKLSVQGGEQRTLTVVLERESPSSRALATAQASTATDAEATSPKLERRWYKNAWLWTGVGLVLAGAAAGAGYALTRSSSAPEPYTGNVGVALKGP